MWPLKFCPAKILHVCVVPMVSTVEGSRRHSLIRVMASLCEAFVEPPYGLCVSTSSGGVPRQKLPHLWAALTGRTSFLTSRPTPPHPGTHMECWELFHTGPPSRVSNPKAF